ncbi:MAG: hypothetical protein AB7N24_00620 [Dehalococcoidia bacterium]
MIGIHPSRILEELHAEIDNSSVCPGRATGGSRSDILRLFPFRETQKVEEGKIVVSIGDEWLAGALTLWLAAALPGRDVVRGVVRSLNGSVAPRDIVLLTPSDCSPEELAELSSRGLQAIVLAPVHRADEADRYTRAGADYIVMSVDNAKLLTVLQRSAPSDAMASCAASNHRPSLKNSHS